MRANRNKDNIIFCKAVLDMFLIWLNLLPSAFTKSLCESICICTNTTVNCSYRKFCTIPNNIPNDTITLDFSSNTVLNISNHSFENLRHLQHLDLSFNNIETIDNNAFVGPRHLIGLNLKKCSLSAKDLPKLYGLGYLEDLDFGSCSTPNLTEFTFKRLTRLKRLDLSNNGIKYIHKDAFVGLDSLQVLDLSRNELCISELHPRLFRSLSFLKNFLIFTDNDNFSCKSLKTNLFFPTLENLSIGVQDLPFDFTMWGMKNLSFLALAGTSKVNISKDSFLHVDTVTTLSIFCYSHFNCVSLTPDALHNLFNLRTLFINVSYFDTLPLMLPNGLKNCRSLRKIQIRNILRGILSKNTLLPFENLQIEELVLEVGSDAKIVGDSLRILPKSLNTIEFIHSFVDFYSVVASGFDELPNLSLLKIRTHKFQTLTSKMNALNFVSSDHLGHNVKRKSLIVSKRKHTLKWPNNASKETGKERFKRDNINTDKYQSFLSHTKMSPESFLSNRSLKLDYSRNNVYIKFDYHHLIPIRIDYLDISFNPIYRLPLSFATIFSHVRVINLSNTKLYTISGGTFQKIPNLAYLDLQSNHLINIFENELLLQNLTNLKYLNLANNDITKVPKSVLKGVRNLEGLNLSSNSIQIINVDISHTRLTSLDLSFNKIQFISDMYSRQIEKLCKKSHLTINLAGNPLMCTCENFEFFQLIFSCGISLKDAHWTYCDFQNETRTTLDDVNRIMGYLEQKCKSKIAILLGSVFASLCLLFLLLGVLAYKYRWRLRYLYYASKLRWSQSSKYTNAYQNIFEYDAFVSYTDRNSTFVRNEMIPNLEIEHNIKLCVHERDFMAGESVAFNISYAINSSKRTLIILTEDFLQSNWCMYELNIARVEDLNSDRNVILVIIFNDLDLNKLPLDVMDLMRSKTYLKYPIEGTDRDTFWRKCAEFIH